MQASRILAICAVLLPLIQIADAGMNGKASARCPDRPPCRGCGCKGGPGYRSNATGKCVGFKALAKTCGEPPTLRCTFENAPGTGLNRECALGSSVGKPDD